MYLVDPETGDFESIGDDPESAVPAGAAAVVDGDQLFMTLGGALRAVDLPSGAVRWTDETTGFVPNGPVVAGDEVIIQRVVNLDDDTITDDVIAYDRDSGDVRWTKRMPFAGSGPALVGDVLIASAPLSALDPTDGSVLWEVEPERDLVGNAAYDPERDLVLAVLRKFEGDTELIDLVAVDADSGEERWRTPLDAAPAFTESVTIEGDVVVVPELGFPVFGFDADTGAERWQFAPPPPSVHMGIATIEDGQVWVLTSTAQVFVLDALDGEVLAQSSGPGIDVGSFFSTMGTSGALGRRRVRRAVPELRGGLRSAEVAVSPRLRPTRLTVVATAGLIGVLGLGAVRELLWDELRGGMLNLRGLRRPLQVLVVFGFALLLLMLVAMLFHDFLRGRYDLAVLPGGTPGRGSLVPSPLLSVTLFVLAVGWAFVLASAIETPLGARVALLALYVCFASVWQGFGLGDQNDRLVAAGWVGVIAVVVLYALRLKLPARPVLDFALLLGFVTLTFAVGQYRLFDFDRSSGGVFGLFQATQSVELLSTFVLPLLFLIGLDIAAFALNIGEFGTHFVEDRFPNAVLPILAAVTAALAVLQSFFELRDTFDGPDPWQSMTGAALLPLGFALLWAIVHVRRRVVGAEDEEFIDAARSWGPRLVVWIFLPLLVQTLLLLTLNFVNATKLTEDPEIISRWQDLSTWVFDRQGLWNDLTGPVFLAVACWLVMRRRRSAALFVGGVGVIASWNELTAPDGWLSDLGTTRVV